MDQEHEDYADPEPPDKEEREFTRSVITGAVVLMCLAFFIPCVVGLAYHFSLFGLAK